MGRMRNKLHRLLSKLVVQRYRMSGVAIGRDCLISRTAKIDLTNPSGVKIGDETAVSFNAAILAHDFVNNRHVTTEIGSQCFVGARSIVMPGVKVGDNVIIGAGSVVYSDVDPNTVVAGNPARVVERGIVTGKYGIKIAALKKPVPAPLSATQVPSNQSISTGSDADLLREFFGDVSPDQRFSDSQIDSFELISIRAKIETHLGREISDADWEAVEKPADALRFLKASSSAAHSPDQGIAAQFRKSLEIGMPQMGANGLSESWLFKEMGDAHWQMICGALGVKSNAIKDQDGNRLYATFTRIKLAIDGSLSSFKENDQLTVEGRMNRMGAGIFLSDFTLTTDKVRATLSMMSSFARFGVEGDNASLTKGQPVLPPDFAIPNLAEPPATVTEYKAERARGEGEAIFSTAYELVPYHDINGVGLLYFAAYPAIHDISLARYFPRETRLDTISREISYFANSGEHASVAFQLESVEEKDDRIETVGVLKRQDGKRMASVRAAYAKK